VGKLQATAAAATVWDGASSPTSARVIGFSGNFTIGQVFSAGGVLAASQPDGSAIWVRSATLANTSPITTLFGFVTLIPAFVANGGPTAYAEALMLHEVIHKFGVIDKTLAGALGVPFDMFNDNNETDSLFKKCF